MFNRFKTFLAKWIGPPVAQRQDACPFDPAELARLIKRGQRADFEHIARVFSVHSSVPHAAPPLRRGGGRSRLTNGS